MDGWGWGGDTGSMDNQIGAVRQYELLSLDEFIVDVGECGFQPLWET